MIQVIGPEAFSKCHTSPKRKRGRHRFPRPSLALRASVSTAKYVLKPLLIALAVLWTVPGAAEETVSFGDAPGTWHIKGLNVHHVDGTLKLRAEPGASGYIENAALPLVPLHRYRLTIESERGPGTEVRFELVQQRADGSIYRRPVVFMLPDEIRPNHWPLSPYRNTYVAGFALAPDTKTASLRITIKGSSVLELAYFRLHRLKIDDLGEVPFSDHPGRDLMPFGQILGEVGDPLPKYWSQWVHKADENQKLVDDGPRSAPLCFSVDAPDKWLLLVCPNVPIEVGRAYRIVVYVRGEGRIGLAAQVLGPHPVRPRVGDPQSRTFQVDSKNWRRLEHIWFADAKHGLVAQVYFNTTGSLDLDDVAFELIPPRNTP